MWDHPFWEIVFWCFLSGLSKEGLLYTVCWWAVTLLTMVNGVSTLRHPLSLAMNCSNWAASSGCVIYDDQMPLPPLRPPPSPSSRVGPSPVPPHCTVWSPPMYWCSPSEYWGGTSKSSSGILRLAESPFTTRRFKSYKTQTVIPPLTEKTTLYKRCL